MGIRFALVVVVVLVGAVAVACGGSSGQTTAIPPPASSATPAALASWTPSPEPARSPAATPTRSEAPATPTATTPAPTARRTSTPTTRPTSTPAPASGARIEHGPRQSKMVALTFDMGGRVEPARDIVNWLVANRIQATIFMTGAMADNVNTEAGRNVLRLVDTHRDLFALGNHSYSHPDFQTLSATEMRDELVRTEKSLAKYTGVSPRPFFRPPFGGVDGAVVDTVAAAGYSYTVMWDIDTIDWKPEADGGPTTAEMVSKVATGATGGSIVLMHLGGYNTLEALPAIIRGLQTRGFELVTLATMLR